jgi:two-component system response regulator
MVRTRRNRMGISQEELGERAGLHRTYIADIERGARNPSLESINKLAGALEVSISTLFSPAQPAQTETSPTRQAAPNSAVDILLVEDNPDDVKLTLLAFQQANLGNRIHIARDGAEALDYLFGAGHHAGRGTEPRREVVLLNLRLRKVDGMTVLRRIKSDDRTRAIPVVILTSSQQDRDIAECLRIGADACIIKPVDFNRLSQVTPRLQLSWMLQRQVQTSNR